MLRQTVQALVVLGIFISQAHAETFFNCDREGTDISGFINFPTMETIFPKRIYFDAEQAVTKGSNARVEFTSGYENVSAQSTPLYHGLEFVLYDKGKMKAKVARGTDYIHVMPRWYYCAITSGEVLSILSEKTADRSDASRSSSAGTDTQTGGLSLEAAKNECRIIGFKEGSEKFGDCVMKLLGG